MPGRGGVRGKVSPLLLLLRSSGGASTTAASPLALLLLTLFLLLLPLLLLLLLLLYIMLALGVQALEAADLRRGDVDATVRRGGVGAGPEGVVGVGRGLFLVVAGLGLVLLLVVVIGAAPEGVVGVDRGLPLVVAGLGLVLLLVVIGSGWWIPAAAAAVVSAMPAVRTSTGTSSGIPSLGARPRLRPGLGARPRLRL